MSGYHFITDVVGGAVVGSSLGILIASVHNSPVHVVPVNRSDYENGGIGISRNILTAKCGEVARLPVCGSTVSPDEALRRGIHRGSCVHSE